MEEKNQNIEVSNKKDLTQEEIEDVQGGYGSQQQQRGSDYYRDGKVVEILNNHGQEVFS